MRAYNLTVFLKVGNSFNLESLAKVTRLLDELDALNLLLEEDCEEVGVFSGAAKKLLKGILILLSSHESWG